MPTISIGAPFDVSSSLTKTICWPRGSSPGKSRAASGSSMRAIGAPASDSSSARVKPRPRSTVSPSDAK